MLNSCKFVHDKQAKIIAICRQKHPQSQPKISAIAGKTTCSRMHNYLQLHAKIPATACENTFSVVQYDLFLCHVFLRLCFQEVGPLISEIKTKPQLYFAASFLKDVKILLHQLVTPSLGNWFFKILGEIFLDKKQRVLTLHLKYNYCSKLSSVTSHPKCNVLSSGIRDRIVLSIDSFPSIDKNKKSEKVTTASFQSIWR